MSTEAKRRALWRYRVRHHRPVCRCSAYEFPHRAGSGPCAEAPAVAMVAVPPAGRVKATPEPAALPPEPWLDDEPERPDPGVVRSYSYRPGPKADREPVIRRPGLTLKGSAYLDKPPRGAT